MSLPLALLVTPVFHAFFDDAASRFKRKSPHSTEDHAPIGSAIPTPSTQPTA